MKDNESLLKGLICLNSAYRVKTHTNTDTCIILHYCKKKKKKSNHLPQQNNETKQLLLTHHQHRSHNIGLYCDDLR